MVAYKNDENINMDSPRPLQNRIILKRSEVQLLTRSKADMWPRSSAFKDQVLNHRTFFLLRINSNAEIKTFFPLAPGLFKFQSWRNAGTWDERDLMTAEVTDAG